MAKSSEETTKIGGYDVMFPFKPYPLQKAYMSQVIRCLREKQNGLLESPTGTGKTLSLLCSTLAWLEKTNRTPLLQAFEASGASNVSEFFKNEPDDDDDLVEVKKFEKAEKKPEDKKGPQNDAPTVKVFYSSRTHAQLSQACKEMKRSSYNYMSGLVMGGRDNLCINPEVAKLPDNSAKTHACRAKTRKKQCEFAVNIEKKVTVCEELHSTPVKDIEDLLRIGRKNKLCPYFATRFLKQKADVIFMPYNYLLDPSARKALDIQISKNIIIFDEGHNIERICEDSVSGELKSETIELLIKEFKTLAYHLRHTDINSTLPQESRDAMQGLSVNSVNFLKDTLIALQGEIEKAVKGEPHKKVHEQKWVFEILEAVGINFEKRKDIFETIDEIMNYCIDSSLIAGNTTIAAFSTHLTKLNDFFLIIFPDTILDEQAWLEFKGEFIKKYRIFSEKEGEENDSFRSDGLATSNGSYPSKKLKSGAWVTAASLRESSDGSKPWTLYLWCLSASIALNGIQRHGSHCIIITSGTLAPLQSFQIELETPFPVILQNRHIVDESQIGIYILKEAYNGTVYDTRFSNRENTEVMRALGQSILHFCRIIPGGVLLFFSSYAVMNNIMKIWKMKDKEWKIISTLRTIKTIFEEPRDKNEFSSCIEEFRKKIDESNSRGALFMGVCRGKLSEGLDMADKYCRGVMMVGLPFPALMDPRVVIKQQYLTEQKNRELTAKDWYSLQMKRALNQAIGRIVRHKDDYGVVLLLDTRFEQFSQGLSRWMQPFIKTGLSYSNASKAVSTFFERHESKSKDEIVLN